MEGSEKDMWHDLSFVLKYFECVLRIDMGGQEWSRETIEEVRNGVTQTWMAVVKVLKCSQSLPVFSMHVIEVTKLPSKRATPVYLPTNKGDFLFLHTPTEAAQYQALEALHTGR